MSETQPPLSKVEIERYARHIVLPEIGGAGQQKLKKIKVLVVGSGGLGAPVLQYLAAAGIGTLGIIDDDRVSLSNLQRQVIFDTDLVGQPKVEAAASRISHINPHVRVETHDVRLNADNARDLISRYDIIVDGSDNFETRYLVADVCEQEKRPLVAAALGRFDGTLTVLKPYEERSGTARQAHEDDTPRAQNPHGDDTPPEMNPRYRDLFPEAPPAGLVPSCAEAGVLGALAGVMGTLQAMEVIKLAAEIGEPLVGRLLMYDALAARFDVIKYRRSAS
jgi:molybdopterin-synthase adenylyltransferase